MSTYFDKKNLIESNKDLYISDYDKTLNPTALAGIIDAKKEYKAAEQKGDTASMQKANTKANNIRQANGGYDGGKDGSEYNKTPKSYEIRNTTAYKSPYDEQKKKIVSLISDIEDFNYDPLNDPLFKTYRNIYTRLGEDAYDRAMSENALRTGGTFNTSAQSAALQAQNKYNTMLTDKIPELYEAAYEKYSDKYDRLYKSLDMLSELDNEQYSRYRDDMDDFESDRDYFYNKYLDEQKYNQDMYEFESGLEYDIIKDNAEAQYEKERDIIEDAKWREELDEENFKNRMNAAINLAKAMYSKTAVPTSVVRQILNMLY